jgi:ubiquinone/menaquinone biosynthesis C-methylase UbiE
VTAGAYHFETMTRRLETMTRRHKKHGRYGNPVDLARMVARQLDPKRAAWQRPAAVVSALRLRRGQVVAEIGSGPGYFTLRLARAVGPSGRVYAVDPEPAMLEVLRDRLRRAGLRNVTPVLGLDADPLLPVNACHFAIIVNAYHHFRNGPAVLRRLARALAPGGRVVNIDWAARETPVGPSMDRRITPETFCRDARRAGFAVTAEHRMLPHQYFFVMERRRGMRTAR